MKIDTHDLPGIVPPRKANTQLQAPTGCFDALLEKAMSPPSGQTSPPGIVPALQSISAADIAAPAGADRRQTVKRIDEYLSIMEAYQGKMADPKASLKDAYPFVQQMEKETAALLPAMESLPTGDKLKDILNHLLVASTVEITKFNRGDYV